MIPRYSPQDVAELFSDEHRFDTMLEVELLAAEGLAELGVLPHDDVAQLRQRRPVIDAEFVAAVDEREQVTNHDTAAFVDVVQARIGMPEGEVDPLRSDLFGRRRHRALFQPLPGHGHRDH
jgi:adenylosuccinate lyase